MEWRLILDVKPFKREDKSILLYFLYVSFMICGELGMVCHERGIRACVLPIKNCSSAYYGKYFQLNTRLINFQINIFVVSPVSSVGRARDF